MPDVFDLLKQDHIRLKAKLSELKVAGSEDRMDLAVEVLFELSRHADFEEEVLFPQSKRFLDKDTIAIIEDEQDEHRQLEYLISQLSEVDPNSVYWEMHFARLHTLFDRHSYNEEKAFFPKARKMIPAKTMAGLTRSFQQYLGKFSRLNLRASFPAPASHEDLQKVSRL